MAVNETPNKHVLQVAKLIRFLNQDEIKELIQLVPQLQQVEPKSTTAQGDDVVQWAREQMARYETHAEPMQNEDLFLNDITVEEYFNLSEDERERIWSELYTTAIETMKEREIKSDAVVSAG